MFSDYKFWYSYAAGLQIRPNRWPSFIVFPDPTCSVVSSFRITNPYTLMLPDLQSGRSEYKDLQSAAHCLGLKSVPRDSQAMATNSPPKLGGAGVVCLRQKWGILFASKPHPQHPPLWERWGACVRHHGGRFFVSVCKRPSRRWAANCMRIYYA